MLLQLISIVFSSGECQTGCNNALDRRVICQVQEESDAVQTPVLFKVLLEEAGGFHVHTHSSEHHREIVLVAVENALGGPFHKTSLSDDLGGNLAPNKLIRGGQGV